MIGLNKTATISRATESGTGYEKDTTWAATSSNVPCRISFKRGAEVGQGFDGVEATHRIFMAYGTDVVKGDCVAIDGVDYMAIIVNRDAGGAGHHLEIEAKEGLR